MKPHKVFYLLAAVAALIYGCKKKEPDNSYYNLEEAKAYTYFKTGTYWIYQDSISGVEDCVFVTDNLLTKDTSEGKIYDYYFTETYNTYNNTKNTYWMHQSWAIQYKDIPVWRTTKRPNESVTQTNLLVYPFVVNKTYYPYTNVGYIMLKEIISIGNFSGSSFNNIVKFYDSGNSTDYGSETNYYIARNIGIIRKEIIDSVQVWNISRYNIVQ